MTLLEQVKTAFQNVRGSVVIAMQALHVVKESGDWQEVAGSWGEYVESELGISQGFASKLLTVNQHYLLDGGLSQEQITGIDYESLFMARTLSGSLEEQVAKARNLTRAELRAEKNDEHPHQHEWIEICKKCSIRNYEENSTH